MRPDDPAHRKFRYFDLAVATLVEPLTLYVFLLGDEKDVQTLQAPLLPRQERNARRKRAELRTDTAMFGMLLTLILGLLGLVADVLGASSVLTFLPMIVLASHSLAIYFVGAIADGGYLPWLRRRGMALSSWAAVPGSIGWALALAAVSAA